MKTTKTKKVPVTKMTAILFMLWPILLLLATTLTLVIANMEIYGTTTPTVNTFLGGHIIAVPTVTSLTLLALMPWFIGSTLLSVERYPLPYWGDLTLETTYVFLVLVKATKKFKDIVTQQSAAALLTVLYYTTILITLYQHRYILVSFVKPVIAVGCLVFTISVASVSILNSLVNLYQMYCIVKIRREVRR